MRSRTDSESVRTSRPSTRAEPPLSGKRPVSILMTVVFPLPLGPRKPKISPFSTRKLTSLTAVKSPKRRTRLWAEMAASGGAGRIAATGLTPRFQLDVGGHAGADAAGGIGDANFHAEDLMHALFPGLHVARQKFGLLVDLLHDAVENGVGKGIDTNFRLLAEAHTAKLGLRNIDADVDLIAFEKRGDRRVGGNEIARAHVEDLNNRRGRSGDLAFAEASFVIGEGGLREFDVFPAVAALKFFQVRLSLVIVGLGGGNFFRTIAALEFGQLVLGIFL